MAVALDTFLDLGRTVAGTTLSGSFTCTGANRLLLVGVGTVVDLITGVTYGGTPMTLLTKQVGGAAGTTFLYVFYLIAPATGSNTITISRSVAGLIESQAISYTGVEQVAFPDSSNSTNGTSGTLTGTTTVVSSNSWLYMFSSNEAGTVTAGTNCTLRINTGNFAMATADSNGVVGTGSQSMTETVGGSPAWITIIASIAPPSAIVVSDRANYLTLLGVN